MVGVVSETAWDEKNSMSSRQNMLLGFPLVYGCFYAHRQQPFQKKSAALKSRNPMKLCSAVQARHRPPLQRRWFAVSRSRCEPASERKAQGFPVMVSGCTVDVCVRWFNLNT